jgi:putative membrane protein
LFCSTPGYAVHCETLHKLEEAIAVYTWNFEPTLVLGLLLQPIIYLALIGPLRRFFPDSAPVPASQQQTFLLGSLTIFIALVSPIDTMAEQSLAMHMVQHLFLTLFAAPLLLIGTPKWLFRPLLRLPFALPVGRLITNPLVAFLVYNIVFSAWHVPRLYELALTSRPVHIAEHITMLVTAVLTWWPIFSPLDELPGPSDPAKCIYLFFQSIPPTILGALITFATTIIYPTYERSQRVIGLSPLEDQQLGGLIMWVPGGLVFFFALSFIFLRFLNRDEDEPGMATRS